MPQTPAENMRYLLQSRAEPRLKVNLSFLLQQRTRDYIFLPLPPLKASSFLCQICCGRIRGVLLPEPALLERSLDPNSSNCWASKIFWGAWYISYLLHLHSLEKKKQVRKEQGLVTSRGWESQKRACPWWVVGLLRGGPRVEPRVRGLHATVDVNQLKRLCRVISLCCYD